MIHVSPVGTIRQSTRVLSEAERKQAITRFDELSAIDEINLTDEEEAELMELTFQLCSSR